MDSSSGLSIFPMLIILGFVAFFIYCSWKLFEKAGHEGWKSIIPFYNLYIMLEIAGMPGINRERKGGIDPVYYA